MTTPLRPFGRPDVPLPTGREAAAFDRHAIDELGVPEPVLMENAGRATACLVQRLWPEGEVVGVVGGGNNGGDALVALRTLAAWGRRVRAVLVADRSREEPLLHGWSVHRVSDAEHGDAAWELLAGADVVLDGVLGTGIRGAPRERQARAIHAINEARAPVLALDVPSGVDADTGAAAAEAVLADVTVAFGWPKLGTLLGAGRRQRGRLVAVEIGFPSPDGPFGAALVTPAWAAARRPRRPPETHKYDVGTVLVVAGRPGVAGAAVLAGSAALRAGAGLVHVASSEANRPILQAVLPEAIFVDVDDHAALRRRAGAVDALAVGPGMGTDDRAAGVLAELLEASGSAPLVLDADALTLLGAGRPAALKDVCSGRSVLVTPHVGEMTRITDVGADAIRADRVGVARDTAEGLGCAVLLKGLPSVVAAPGRPVLVDTQGTSDLATGGVGDVLTGTAGALLARGLGPREAGALALHLSGRAAARARRGEGLLPRDVVAELPGALSEEGSGVTDLDLPFVLLDLDPPR